MMEANVDFANLYVGSTTQETGLATVVWSEYVPPTEEEDNGNDNGNNNGNGDGRGVIDNTGDGEDEGDSAVALSASLASLLAVAFSLY